MLEGKVAIVTGGATGIGAATSRLLAQNGAHVVASSEQPLEAIHGTPLVDIKPVIRADAP